MPSYPAAPPARQLAKSFSIATTETAKIAGVVGPALASIPPPAGAILFASGALAETAQETLAAVRDALGPVPALLGTGAGVLTERGEHERTSALSGLVWSGGTASTLIVPADRARRGKAPRVAESIAEALGERPGTVILFVEPDVTPGTFDSLAESVPYATIVGAGTLPRGAWTLSQHGAIERGSVAGLVLRGLARPVVRTSPACKLLGRPEPITECQGAMVLRIGERSAIEVLSASARGLSGQPLVFAVLAAGDQDPRPGQGNLLIRGIRGVDPARGGVVVTDEVRPGMRLCFGTRDGATARADLESAVREAAREVAGAAPRFGLFISCAGRGIGLYGAADVDATIVQNRFPHVPFAGMFSSFEIGPSSRGTAMHLYTGILTLFCAPS